MNNPQFTVKSARLFKAEIEGMKESVQKGLEQSPVPAFPYMCSVAPFAAPSAPAQATPFLTAVPADLQACAQRAQRELYRVFEGTANWIEEPMMHDMRSMELVQRLPSIYFPELFAHVSGVDNPKSEAEVTSSRS